MHEGVPRHCFIAVKDIVDVVQPFVVTAYPSSEIVNNDHLANNVSGLIKCLNNFLYTLMI